MTDQSNIPGPILNKKGFPIPNIVTTAEYEAGLNVLWKASKKICMFALAWHLPRDLETRKLGINEEKADKYKWLLGTQLVFFPSFKMTK